eukprot:856720-Pleurochrysis_carterae.AAC.2
MIAAEVHANHALVVLAVAEDLAVAPVWLAATREGLQRRVVGVIDLQPRKENNFHSQPRLRRRSIAFSLSRCSRRRSSSALIPALALARARDSTFALAPALALALALALAPALALVLALASSFSLPRSLPPSPSCSLSLSPALSIPSSFPNPIPA